MSASWFELSDDKLQARLVQSVDEPAVRFLVTHREDPLAAKMIGELLGN